MTAEPGDGLTTWCEVSRASLASNLRLFRSLLSPGTSVMAVVKANAYGHGVAPVVRECLDQGIGWLGVHSVPEALEVCELGAEVPILVMGWMTPEEAGLLPGPQIHAFVSTAEAVETLAAQSRRLGCRIPVHVKVDTGTHRQGVYPEDAGAIATAAQAAGLDVVGVATHFANIEDTTDHTYAMRQLDRFRAAVERVKAVAPAVRWVHAACSAAALLFREADFSLVRVGISLYGHWPSRETYLSWMMEHGREGVRLEPVLAWRARVGQIKDVAAREPIGYGLTYRTTRASRIAVLPVGYAEGYPRALSNRARVLVRGRRVPVVGRVCMDITLIDVTDVPEVAVGDIVTLLGRDGDDAVTAEELAEMAGTINYEILARLSPRVPRVVV